MPATAFNPGSQVIVQTSSGLAIPANTGRVWLGLWCDDPLAIIYGALGSPAALHSGFRVNPNGGRWTTPDPDDLAGAVFTGAVYLISTVASAIVTVVEI